MFISDLFENAESTSTSPTTEAKRMSKKDPCWKGYHMVGTKDKSGKQVPNCVPVSEDSHVSDVITARELINKAVNHPDSKHEYFNFLKHLRTKHGADYSTQIHQQAAKLAKG